MEDAKQKILDSIVAFYLSSHDFNGLPGSSLLEDRSLSKDQIIEILRELIVDQQIILLHQDFDVNVHILRVYVPDISQQLARVDGFESACLYPSPIVLEKVVDKTNYSNKPYNLAMALGSPQLAYKSFDLSVLEFYRNDPRYRYENDDIRGSISYSWDKENPEEEHRDHILLQTFGFSYDDEYNRAVAVFVRYLADLTPEHQQIWKAKEVEGGYKLHPDYYDNTILGNWGRKIGLLEALLLELRVINEMAIAINGSKFFREDFFEKRPREFSFLVRPTVKEYNDFVLLLDKMISENINRDFFRGRVSFETEEFRRDGKLIIREKGTLSILDEWLRGSFRTPDPEPLNKMIKTIRDIRGQRQKPAHRIDENRFDQSYFKMQRELALNAYEAVRLLRLILTNHPKAQKIKVPDQLFKGEIWPM